MAQVAGLIGDRNNFAWLYLIEKVVTKMNEVMDPRKLARLSLGAVFVICLLVLVGSLVFDGYTNIVMSIVMVGGIFTLLGSGALFVGSLTKKQPEYALLLLALGGVLLILSPAILAYIGFAMGGAG